MSRLARGWASSEPFWGWPPGSGFFQPGTPFLGVDPSPPNHYNFELFQGFFEFSSRDAMVKRWVVIITILLTAFSLWKLYPGWVKGDFSAGMKPALNLGLDLQGG